MDGSQIKVTIFLEWSEMPYWLKHIHLGLLTSSVLCQEQVGELENFSLPDKLRDVYWWVQNRDQA